MSKELEKAILRAGDLPTIPLVAIKVMKLIEKENASVDELAKIVAADPAVAARVIKISNSAFYGCQRQIKTLSGAIVILGFNTLKSLVVAASIKEVYKPFDLFAKRLWEHSFGAALAARIIAINTRLANEEESFLGGLFQDVGKIIMNNLDREKFQTVMQKCSDEGASFEEIEKTVYQFSHDAVGAYVMKKWNFPETLIKAILHHHQVNFSTVDDIYLIRLVCIIGLADMFCQKLGIGENEPRENLDLSKSSAAQLFNLEESRIAQLLEMFRETFERDKAYFLA